MSGEGAGMREEGTQDWKAIRLAWTEQARKLLETMTLEEKVALMSGTETKQGVRGALWSQTRTHYNENPYQAGGAPDRDIPAVRFVDGTRGVVCGRGTYTCFPVTAMRGATFDPAMEEAVGRAIAEEVLDAGGNLFGGVCVNLPVHPGWGRAQESYGEDPCLLGKMGAALVRGVQDRGVIACVKHFAFNSMENARFKVSVSCSRRAEREVFLPHFQKCIEAGVGALMCAYNSYEGVLCGHQEYLLNRVLKGEWGFDGFVMNDFLWGIRDTVAAVNGGLDLEMPSTQFFGEKLVRAVREGKVPQARIDEAALRMVRTLLAHRDRCAEALPTGHLKPEQFRQHAALALQCAREGITLLKNEGGLLPIPLGEGRVTVAVLGRLADRENTGDHGSSRVYAPYTKTLLQGMADWRDRANIVYYDGQQEAHCKRLARQADYVVLVVGNDYTREGESFAREGEQPAGIGGDRVSGLGLEEGDLRMIRAVSEVRRDAVVALMGGSTITMEGWHDRVGAILYVYYPGMEGGTAFAEVLFGKANPGGKLPFVIPRREEDLPAPDWNAEQVVYPYLHGYTLLEEKKTPPLYPFGFGLSYTRFSVKALGARWKNGQIAAAVSVENTGSRSGAEVVQLYIGAPASAVRRPARLLKDFRRVELRCGEKTTVELGCSLRDLAWYDEQRETFVEEPGPYEVYVGTSSALQDLVRLDLPPMP